MTKYFSHNFIQIFQDSKLKQNKSVDNSLVKIEQVLCSFLRLETVTRNSLGDRLPQLGRGRSDSHGPVEGPSRIPPLERLSMVGVKKCPHNRQKSQCRYDLSFDLPYSYSARECGGGSFCKHNRIRAKCKGKNGIIITVAEFLLRLWRQSDLQAPEDQIEVCSLWREVHVSPWHTEV